MYHKPDIHLLYITITNMNKTIANNSIPVSCLATSEYYKYNNTVISFAMLFFIRAHSLIVNRQAL